MYLMSPCILQHAPHIAIHKLKSTLYIEKKNRYISIRTLQVCYVNY